jgi:hypothetical protein
LKYDADLVEYVVCEVIRRLRADGRFVARADSPAATAADRTGKARELAVPDRLVTMATLQGRLDGVTQLKVPRRSVITPSVRDELKLRMIELKRDE